MDGSTIYRVIEKYALSLGINKAVSPHSCRATVISHLLDTQNTAIRDVASFAGHANITTTERYDKRRKNLDKSAAYQVDYLLKKA
jgi:integrase/recombinase XerD